MATFTITGDVDPFLHVSLPQGERIHCESNSMVMMESTLDLDGTMGGGFGRALMRKLTNGESLFQQSITAVRGAGDCLLSPVLPGMMMVLQVGPARYMMNDGAFVAAEDGVDVQVRMQNLGGAIFGQTGGFFVGEATGRGQLVVSGFGSGFELQVAPDKDVVIDNAHVVAWDSALRYEVTVPNQGRSMFGRMLTSVTSGEGLVLRFSGTGKVIVCSRNRDGFVEWMRKEVGAVGGSRENR